MNHLVLIDGNNWGFSGVAKAPLFAGSRQTQSINYVINRVYETYIAYPKATIFVLWDGRSWRKDIYAEYKGKRESTEKQREIKDEYMRQKPDILLGLKLLGVPQITYGNLEADDVAYMMTKNAVAKGIPVTLLTADEDWQQLVQPGVNWIDLIHDKKCHYDSFYYDTTFKNAKQFVEAKCILGDVGDNVIGLHGIGEKALEGIYSIYESFIQFLNTMEVARENEIINWKNIRGKTMPKPLREIDIELARTKIAENMRLVDLATPDRPEPLGKKLVRQPLDRDGFIEFCHRNSFNKMARNADEFLLAFK